MRSATDDIGDQYAPGNTNVIKMTITSASTQETFQDGVTSSVLLADEITTVTSNQEIINAEQPFWG